MRSCIAVSCNKVSGDLECQVCLLQVLVVDHGADFSLNSGCMATDLTGISARQSIHAHQSVQVKLSLLLLEEVEEGGEEHLGLGDGNKRSFSVHSKKTVGSDH